MSLKKARIPSPGWGSFVLTGLAIVLWGCAGLPSRPPGAAAPSPALSRALEGVRLRHAPDRALSVYRVEIAELRGRDVTVTGWVESVSVRDDVLAVIRDQGYPVTDRIEVLPSTELGEATWGLACISVASGREQPENTAELGTQILMGHPVRVWKRSGIWYLTQAADRYVCWLEKGTFVRCARAELDEWNASPLLIVTAFEEIVREAPQPDAPPVSDVVTGCLIRRVGEDRYWYRVRLPDGRGGFLPKSAAEDYALWRATREPTPVNIERTARSFLGRPYLWGGNSPKGFDCSGFNKLVFFLNGIELARNSSHQCRQGIPVPLDAELGQLRKGDLLFFGHRATRDRPERITHTGIYLGDKMFIHASEMVRINSLDRASPIRDEARIQKLLHARRVLPEPTRDW